MFLFKKSIRIIFPILLFSILILSFQKGTVKSDSCELGKSFDRANFHLSPIEGKYDKLFEKYPEFVSRSFDFPVGKPNGANYFKAREFGQDKHLGEDWNGKGGGNTDLGDPVYSISNGYVTFAEHVCCGWGNIVRIVHKFPDHPEYPYVESFYAHLDEINVKPGNLVPRGYPIGTIGTADGKYSAHLHLELRNFIDMGIGPGYSEDTFGFLAPTTFIKKY